MSLRTRFRWALARTMTSVSRQCESRRGLTVLPSLSSRDRALRQGHAHPATVASVFLTCTVGLLLPIHLSAQAALAGRVVKVTDGDTVQVLTTEGRTVVLRINGIDAPEMGQDAGLLAKQTLSEMVMGHFVNIDVAKADRYGRLIAVVRSGNTDVGLRQIGAGAAWYYRQYEKDVPSDLRHIYAGAEAVAKESRRGLWAAKSPVPPWVFRRLRLDAGRSRRRSPAVSAGSLTRRRSARGPTGRN
jgi:endonuclease YncB( thermonuclease family)